MRPGKNIYNPSSPKLELALRLMKANLVVTDDRLIFSMALAERVIIFDMSHRNRDEQIVIISFIQVRRTAKPRKYFKFLPLTRMNQALEAKGLNCIAHKVFFFIPCYGTPRVNDNISIQITDGRPAVIPNAQSCRVKYIPDLFNSINPDLQVTPVFSLTCNVSVGTFFARDRNILCNENQAGERAHQSQKRNSRSHHRPTALPHILNAFSVSAARWRRELGCNRYQYAGSHYCGQNQGRADGHANSLAFSSPAFWSSRFQSICCAAKHALHCSAPPTCHFYRLPMRLATILTRSCNRHNAHPLL